MASISDPGSHWHNIWRMRQLRTSIVVRIRRSSRDRFLIRSLLKMYFLTAFTFCVAMNVSSMFPGKKTTLTIQHDERVYQSILIFLMALGVALVGVQAACAPKSSTSAANSKISDCSAENPSAPSYQKDQESEEDSMILDQKRWVLPRHLLHIMRALGTGTILSQIWTIVRRSVRINCDKTVEILSDDQHKNLMLTSDFLYNAIVILTILVQWLWVEKLNSTTKGTHGGRLGRTGGVLFYLAVVHMLVLDNALYVKVTLTESKAVAGMNDDNYTCHQYQHSHDPEEDQRNETHHQHQHIQHKLGSYDYTHQYVLEPLFNAIVIEGLLTFALFLYLTSHYQQDHHHEQKQQKSLSEDIPRMSMDDLVQAAPRVRTSVTYFVLVLAGSLVILSIAVLYTFFEPLWHPTAATPGGGGEDSTSGDMLVYYATSAACYGIAILMHAIAILYETADSTTIGAAAATEENRHAKLDTNLMIAASSGMLALTWFEAITCFYLWHPADTELRRYEHLTTLHLFQSGLKMVHVFFQIVYVSRALTFRNQVQQRLSWRLQLPAMAATAVTNLTFWLVDVYSRVAHDGDSRIAFKFYHYLLWVALSEILYPIAIFYRFHSLICATSLALSLRKTAMISLRKRT